MEERGIDRRVRKTKRQLRQALMDLMSEKPSKSISVRELAERADINRGTFYIHYKDVSDLLQRLEDEMAERLILVCKKYAYSTSEVDAFPYLTELYRFARDNADLCLVLLGPNGDRAYTERICVGCRRYARYTPDRPGQCRPMFGAAGPQWRSGVYRAYLRHPTQLFPA